MTTPADIATEFAHVEIVDPNEDGGVLLPRSVRINGVDVGFITEDGIKLDVGSSCEPTTVTLTLLPGRVTIRSS